MNNIDHVYYINLDKDTYKNTKTLEEFKKVNIIDPIRIPAVNGKELLNTQINNMTSSFCKNVATKSAIGCAASHIKTWTQMLKNNDQYAMICEDDIQFVNDNFIELFNTLLPSIPDDFDILFVGCQGYDLQLPSTNPINNYFSIKNPSFEKSIDINDTRYDIIQPNIAYGTHCYIITNKAAQKLLDYFNTYKITHIGHIDFILQNLAKDNYIKRYTIIPNLVVQTSTIDNISSNTTGFPIVPNSLLKNINVSENLPLSYMLSISFIQFLDIPISPWMFIFLICGILFYKLHPVYIVTTFLILTIPDILSEHINIKMYLLSLCLLIIPSLYSYHLYTPLIVLVITFLISTTNFIESFGNNTNKSTIPITIQNYTINLDKNIERWNKLKPLLETSGFIHPQRFSAINGSSLSESQINSLVHPDAIPPILKGERTEHHQLSKGAMGCYLSHITLWKQLYTGLPDSIIIFEDDAQPNFDMNTLGNYMNNVPDDWDIILFGGIYNKYDTINEYVVKLYQFYCLHGYIINKKNNLGKILDEAFPITKQIDSWLSDLAVCGKVNIYAITKNKWEINANNYSTDIQTTITTINNA